MGFGTNLLNRRNQRLADKQAKQKARVSSNPNLANDAASALLDFYGSGKTSTPAPGSASTQVKISGPSQAEQIAAGQRSSFDYSDQQRYGDKDFRNAVALEDVFQIRARMDEPNFFDAIDLLNDNPGIRNNPGMQEIRRNEPIYDKFVNSYEQQQGLRLGPKPQGFVGEGMFGQVKEIAPGYVEKTTPPVVEWPPLSANVPNAGYLFDARDFEREAEVQNLLNKVHIAPKVESFKINNDGTTETISRDLRENFDFGESHYTQLEDTISGNFTPQEKAQALAERNILDVKRKQQEATAISNGILLEDRHEGNLVVNKLTGNPMQIDFGMVREVEGLGKDYQRASTVAEGMRAAGLSDEAAIFSGLIAEAVDNNDSVMLHDLAQQGASRLMKIKKLPENYKAIIT